MLEQLKASQGKKIVLELVNGRIISGTVLAVDEHLVCMGTEEGVGTIPVSTVQIVWESLKRSLTEGDMEQLAEQLKDKFQPQMAWPMEGGQPYAGQDPKAEIACTGFPGFSCARSYICRPPDTCNFSFACPGSYVPSFPSGGGACPFFSCGSFQFGQPCGTFQFGQPCSFLFSCGSFQFSQPCGSFQFGQPCGPFQFGQPCGSFQFGLPCGTFQFGGSQCGVLGGFSCAGQQFFGAPVKPPTTPCRPFQFGGSQCGTVGGFACAGQQFFGLVTAPGTKPQETPLPPTDFAVKEQKKDKE